MKVLRAAWLAALASALCAQTANVNDLLATQRKHIETADLRASGHLVWVKPSGVRISCPITIKARWFPGVGVLRLFVEVGASTKSGPNPAPVATAATHALLEMRTDGQSSILIAHPGDKSPSLLPLEKWTDGPLGSGFSYEDFLEQQYFWPSQTSEGKAKFGSRDCVVVKSTPGPADRTHYAQVKTWIDPSIGFPVYTEKTVKETGAVKEFTSFGLRREQGQWSAHQLEVKTRGMAGSTLLIFDRGSVRANLSAADFSPAQLTRF